MMKAFDHLGYPAHFENLLGGVARLAGVCVLLAPGCLKLKEWSYARFRLTIISAAYSHPLWGGGLMALDPLFFGNSDGIPFMPVLPDAVGFLGRKLNFLVHE